MTDLDTRPASGPRSRRRAILVAIAVVVVIGVAVGLALFQPWRLFTRSSIDEGLPVAAQAPVAAQGPVAAQAPAAAQAPGARPGATTPAPGPTATAADPVPPVAQQTEPTVLSSGTFVDGEHRTTGTVNILQLPDGSRFVRLQDFSTSDGPDVHVWITDQQAGGDDWGKYDDGRYLELGDLKATDGNQNYEIPADADLAGLSSVVIWCDRFNVAFGSAPVGL
jgi:Electron transfer DM13